eukprot:scaffold114825_cov14-Tisochrysis_lutea.AAC.1
MCSVFQGGSHRTNNTACNPIMRSREKGLHAYAQGPVLCTLCCASTLPPLASRCALCRSHLKVHAEFHAHPARGSHAQVAAINTAMSSLIKTLNVFPRERLI